MFTMQNKDIIKFNKFFINNKFSNKSIFFFLEYFLIMFKKYINRILIYNKTNYISIELKHYSFLFNILELLKKYFFFDTLSDLICVDYLTKKTLFNFFSKSRFQLNYVLCNYYWNIYLTIVVDPKATFSNNDEILSINTIYQGSNWLERENWDMFGLIFLNHPDLRRIFTDYGFNGFPLRKDFPLCGFIEIYYDDDKKSILYQPVRFAQEYRNFIFVNPWDTYANV